MVYNGKPTRKWLSHEDSASPTVSLESIFLTSIIDAKEERDVMTADIPNAFIQAHMPPVEDGKARVIMNITGVLVDLLVDIVPEIYGPHVVYKQWSKQRKGVSPANIQIYDLAYGNPSFTHL